MASAISHPAVLLALSPAFGAAGRGRRALLLGALCSVLPDIDALGFWLGIPYGAPLGHRGLTHSIAFAAALAAVLAALAFWRAPSRAAAFGFLFLSGASHGAFDAMTDGGLGVAFFAPFDDTRYFLPWRPIEVSPIGLGGFLSRRGLAILTTEALWIWLPCLALGGLRWAVRASTLRSNRDA
ncbi:MAG: metal-dependent hydrolase [Thermoanaerobaculia bacterium]